MNQKDFLSFLHRIDYITKKGRIGGDKRKLTYVEGSGDKMELKTSGIITPDATIAIGPGLPNDTSRSSNPRRIRNREKLALSQNLNLRFNWIRAKY